MAYRFPGLFTRAPRRALRGPAAGFGDLEPKVKNFFVRLMLVGRLELYAREALFMPRFWKS